MTDYSPSTQAAQRWAAGGSRDLTIQVGEIRTALLQAIRALGFATTSEQYSMIEAERGSKRATSAPCPGDRWEQLSKPVDGFILT